nr:hypothetical protein CFP56_16883 [Quercus suber]
MDIGTIEYSCGWGDEFSETSRTQKYYREGTKPLGDLIRALVQMSGKRLGMTSSFALTLARYCESVGKERTLTLRTMPNSGPGQLLSSGLACQIEEPSQCEQVADILERVYRDPPL